jgi:hypothetical protein
VGFLFWEGIATIELSGSFFAIDSTGEKRVIIFAFGPLSRDYQ